MGLFIRNKKFMQNEIISKFREKPKTKTAWWAMGLGLAAIFGGPMLGTFAAVIRPAIDKMFNEKVGIAVGFGVMFAVFAVAVSALVASVRAFKKGERSWVLWVGFIPAILAGAFWVFMLIGEFLFPH